MAIFCFKDDECLHPITFFFIYYLKMLSVVRPYTRIVNDMMINGHGADGGMKEFLE